MVLILACPKVKKKVFDNGTNGKTMMVSGNNDDNLSKLIEELLMRNRILKNQIKELKNELKSVKTKKMRPQMTKMREKSE